MRVYAQYVLVPADRYLLGLQVAVIAFVQHDQHMYHLVCRTCIHNRPSYPLRQFPASHGGPLVTDFEGDDPRLIVGLVLH